MLHFNNRQHSATSLAAATALPTALHPYLFYFIFISIPTPFRGQTQTKFQTFIVINSYCVYQVFRKCLSHTEVFLIGKCKEVLDHRKRLENINNLFRVAGNRFGKRLGLFAGKSMTSRQADKQLGHENVVRTNGPTV